MPLDPLPAAVAAVVLALLAAGLRGRRLRRALRGRRRSLRERYWASRWRAIAPPGAGDADADSQEGERRRTARRTGQLSPIRVAATPGGSASEALVLDWSAGGLMFAADRPLREGEVVYVHPEAAGCPWVPAEVRHCSRHADYHVIGCEFLELPPPEVLSLFGWPPLRPASIQLVHGRVVHRPRPPSVRVDEMGLSPPRGGRVQSGRRGWCAPVTSRPRDR